MTEFLIFLRQGMKEPVVHRVESVLSVSEALVAGGGEEGEEVDPTHVRLAIAPADSDALEDRLSARMENGTFCCYSL